MQAREARPVDAQREREGVTGSRVEEVFHHDAAGLPLARRPRLPPDEPVDRVAPLRLIDRELVASACELVSAVLDPVRPRDQHLSAARAAHFLGAVTVEQLPLVYRVRTEPAADLDDDGAVIAVRQFELLAGRRDQAESSAWYRASSLASSSRFGNRKKTRAAPSRMATIPAV